MKGLRFKVQGSRFEVQGLRFKVLSSGVPGSKLKVWCEVYGFGVEVRD